MTELATQCISQFTPGDHLDVYRGLYWHHGIYVGDNMVIHFDGEPGGNIGDARIKKATLDEFAKGGTPKVYAHKNPRYSNEETVARAHMRLGEDGYSLIKNNCEHFVYWCRTGLHRSLQVNNYTRAAFILMPNKATPVNIGIEVVERAMYKMTCSCGLKVNGMTSIWLCQDCGTRHCRHCLSKRPKKGWGRTCGCGSLITAREKIRQGVG